jgi:branched-chain amino acid transport system permease protein
VAALLEPLRTLSHHRLAGVAVMAAVVAVLPLLFPSAYYYRVAALVFVFALACIGLNLLMGFAGQVSLGHAGFMGIGAYAVAVGPTHLALPSWLSFIAGAAVSALVAFLVGRPILRLKGHYLAVATLGFGLLLAIVFANEARFTGGPDGMTVPRLWLFGWPVRGAETWYWVSGATFLAGAVLALNLIDSPTGRALRAIHDSEVAARVLGIDVAGKKLTVFVVSAVYASVAGSLLALLNGHITPEVSGFLRSIELVAMVVLGGMGSVAGSLVGAALLVVLPQTLTFLHDYEQMVLGLIVMGVMIFLRAGIVPTLFALVPRRA